MTSNLPARRELPAQNDDPIGPGGVPLSQCPDAVLGFALGWSAAKPVHADQYGGVCALVEELMRRDAVTAAQRDSFNPPRSSDGSLWNVVVRMIPSDLARSLQMLYSAHRGKRWDRTGRRT